MRCCCIGVFWPQGVQLCNRACRQLCSSVDISVLHFTAYAFTI